MKSVHAPAVFLLFSALIGFGSACTHTSPRASVSVPTSSPSARPTVQPSPTSAAPVPAALRRALHFPVVPAGQRCPTTPGHQVSTPDFGGYALGSGAVQPILSNLLRDTQVPPWLAFKALWFSVPAYQGPFLIRASRLDGPGSVGLTEPWLTSLFVPAGPTIGGTRGYREAPSSIWVRTQTEVRINGPNSGACSFVSDTSGCRRACESVILAGSGRWSAPPALLRRALRRTDLCPCQTWVFRAMSTTPASSKVSK
jgi:hypothetical protein